MAFRDLDKKIIDHVFKALEPVLHAGSRERLQPYISDENGRLLPASVAVRKLYDHLDSEHGSKNFRPGVVERTGTEKTRDFKLKFTDGRSPLTRAVESLPIRSDARAALESELGYDYQNFTAGEAASQLVSKFGGRDFAAKHLPADYAPPVPLSETRMASVLSLRFYGELTVTEQAAYARRFGESQAGQMSGGVPDHELVNSAARDLARQQKIGWDDPRLTEKAPIVAAESEEPRATSFVV